MVEGYDLSKKRPLEIRVLDRRDEGGISEEEATDNNGLTADAFVLMRVLVDEGKLSMSFSSVEGWAAGEMSFESLFNLWLGMTSHLAKRKTDATDQESLRLFAERVLNLMRMNVDLHRLDADVAAEQASA
jgi:hypothetical protein